MPPLITPELLPARFWALVDRTAGDDSCWRWTGAVTADGYGNVGWKNAPGTYAHVIAYVLSNGPLQPDQPCVLHGCDNRICCNPRHLRAGTKRENSADMALRKRSTIGSANPSAKLSDEDVREVRSLVASGLSHRAVAQRLGLSASNVSLIVSRRRWAHVA